MLIRTLASSVSVFHSSLCIAIILQPLVSNRLLTYLLILSSLCTLRSANHSSSTKVPFQYFLWDIPFFYSLDIANLIFLSGTYMLIGLQLHITYFLIAPGFPKSSVQNKSKDPFRIFFSNQSSTISVFFCESIFLLIY